MLLAPGGQIWLKYQQISPGWHGRDADQDAEILSKVRDIRPERHMHFDVKPYAEAVRGMRYKLLPVVDGLSWGLEMPGLFLWRVRQLYEASVDGIYIYQADARVCTNN